MPIRVYDMLRLSACMFFSLLILPANRCLEDSYVPI